MKLVRIDGVWINPEFVSVVSRKQGSTPIEARSMIEMQNGSFVHVAVDRDVVAEALMTASEGVAEA